jgi:cyanate lyase
LFREGFGRKKIPQSRPQEERRRDPRRSDRADPRGQKEKGLTYAAIAEKLGTHKVWTTAALLGQHPMSAEQADTVVDMLDLDSEVALALQEIPLRGSLDQDVPTDPTIYRIHEITQVYGTTIKALIHEEFGDGIMSAITFQMDVEREETDQGPRVKITYNGKFLPYSWG